LFNVVFLFVPFFLTLPFCFALFLAFTILLSLAVRPAAVRLHLPGRERPRGEGPDQPGHRPGRVLRGPAGDGPAAEHVQRGEQAPRLPPADSPREGGARLAVRHQPPARRPDQVEVGPTQPSEPPGELRLRRECRMQMRFDRYGIRFGLLKLSSRGAKFFSFVLTHHFGNFEVVMMMMMLSVTHG
jgi:hypothetical protein